MEKTELRLNKNNSIEANDDDFENVHLMYQNNDLQLSQHQFMILNKTMFGMCI